MAKLAWVDQDLVAPAFTATFVSPRARTVDCLVVNDTTIVNVASLSLEFVTVPPADHPEPVCAQSFIDTDGRAFGSFAIGSAVGAATGVVAAAGLVAAVSLLAPCEQPDSPATSSIPPARAAAVAADFLVFVRVMSGPQFPVVWSFSVRPELIGKWVIGLKCGLCHGLCGELVKVGAGVRAGSRRRRTIRQ